MSSSGYNANNQVIINRALIETVKPNVLAALYEQVPPCREAIMELYPEGFAFGFQFNSKVGKPIKLMHDIKFQDMIDYYVNKAQLRKSFEQIVMMAADSDESMSIELEWEDDEDPEAIEMGIDLKQNEITKCSLVIFNILGVYPKIERYIIDAKMMKVKVVKFVNFKTSSTSKFVVSCGNIHFEKCSKVPVEMFPAPEDTLSEEYLSYAWYPDQITFVDQHIDGVFDLEKTRELVKETNLSFKRCTFDPNIRLNITTRNYQGIAISMVDFLQCDFSTSQFYDLLSGSQLKSVYLTKCLNFFRENTFRMNPLYGVVKMYYTRSTGVIFYPNEFGWKFFDYRKK